ncbi:hypothetical protein ABGV18_06110, partial [Guyparkeria sp. LHSS19-1]
KPHSAPLPQRPKAPQNMTTDELHERLAYLEAENAYLKKLKALAQEKQSAEKKSAADHRTETEARPQVAAQGGWDAPQRVLLLVPGVGGPIGSICR